MPQAAGHVAAQAAGHQHHPEDRNRNVGPEMDVGQGQDMDEPQHAPALVGPVAAVAELEGQQRKTRERRQAMGYVELLEWHIEEETAEQQAADADVRGSEKNVEHSHPARPMILFRVCLVLVRHQEPAFQVWLRANRAGGISMREFSRES